MLYLPHEESGQGLMEYGLILVLIAVVVISIVTILGTQISSLYSKLILMIPTSGS
jgi:pilus assembly protein Flp/PilA